MTRTFDNDETTRAAEASFDYVRKPIELQTLDALILQTEGRALAMKALREDWTKLSAESQSYIWQLIQIARMR